MRRIVVLGATGHFGHAAAGLLRELGGSFQTAARNGDVDIRFDANDAASIRQSLRPHDIVLDAAGPFCNRSTALLEAACELGFDIVDINDDLQYAQRVIEFAPRVEAASVRVLSSASTVSSVAASVIRELGVTSPRRVSAFLVPASRHTANTGATLSLIRSVGRPVHVLRDGRLQALRGWSESVPYHLPSPVEHITARLFESADAVHLPRIWPSLRDVAMYVDTNTRGVNSLLTVAAHVPALRRFLEWQVRWSTAFARTLGSAAGGIGYEIEDTAGQFARCALVAGENSFLVAVAPAVLAAQAIYEDRFAPRGLAPVDEHVAPDLLFAFLASRGIQLQVAE